MIGWSQNFPSQFGLQLQVKLSGSPVWTQVPPFWHGLEAQGLAIKVFKNERKKTKQKKKKKKKKKAIQFWHLGPLKPLWHRQVKLLPSGIQVPPFEQEVDVHGWYSLNYLIFYFF